MKKFGSWSELFSLVFRKNSQAITARPNQSTTYTASRDMQLPPGDADHVLVSATSTQTLTGKTIDGDDNTVQDLPLTAIKTVGANTNRFLTRNGSGVPSDATALPAGTVVGTSDSQTLTNKTIDGDLNTISDLAIASIKTEAGDANEVFRRDGSGVAVSGPNTIPNNSAIVTTDSTQAITNKDIDGGTASNSLRVTLPKNTTTNLNALTRKEGTMVYDTDTDSVKYDNGSALVALAATATATPSTEGTVTSFTPICKSSVNSVSSANYTVLDTDGYDAILVSTGNSNRTITLPTAADNPGRKLYITKTDSGTGFVIVDGEGSESIDGALTQTLYTQYGKMAVICNGSNWFLIEPIIETISAYSPSYVTVSNLNAPVSTPNIIVNRINNTVTVYGLVLLDQVLTATSTSFDLILPIASNFTTSEDARGSGTIDDAVPPEAVVTANTTDDRVNFTWTSTSNSTNNFQFIVSYIIK